MAKILLNNNNVEAYFKLYADDTVLLADSVKSATRCFK